MDSNLSPDRPPISADPAVAAAEKSRWTVAASPETIDPNRPPPLLAPSAVEPKVNAYSGIHGEPGPPPVSADDFCRLLISSRLVEPPQLEKWLQGKEPFADGKSLSAALVKDKLVTPYQSHVLACGQHRGLVFGRYDVLCPLGQGGMGTVYRARHRRMKREVALKILPRELVKSPEAVQRFHREVEAAARLHHPNIAAAYDADEEDGLHFLVMELVEGPDLAGYVAEAGELPAPVAMHLTIQAARGLAHAHLQDVVHRDVKPANLVVNAQGTLKILDMGLAQLKAVSADAGIELTQMGQAMGTIDYMAPEQAVDARSVDHRADIYGLGCTMFYLLTARPISPDGSIVQKLLWHQSAARPSLCDVCSAATDRLNIIFQRMVAADPNDRYTRMQEVVEDLERVQPELRLGDAELPLVGEDLALYIGLDAIRPPSSHSQMSVPGSGLSGPAPLHATLPPQKTVVPSDNGAAVAAIEQQLASAAIMIGKEVVAQTADGHEIRGVVNHLSVETDPRHPGHRSIRLHVGAEAFGLHEIREVFYGSG